MPLEGLSLVKTLATFKITMDYGRFIIHENYLRNRPSSTKYDKDRLPPLTRLRYIYPEFSPAPIFHNHSSFPHVLSLKRSR